MYKLVLLISSLFFGVITGRSQIYSPIAVTGFTHDVFAETGTNALSTTTTDLDATNHIMYTQGFAAANGITGGVLNSGTFVSGNYTFQLAPFTSNNALYLSLNGAIANTSSSNTLQVTTPASYSNISFLSFSTEGSSTLNVVLTFSDGTVFNAGNFVFQDWFGGPSAIYSSFGRIARLPAGPYPVDGLPSNPRWYAANIPISCTNQTKLLSSIKISYISQSGTSGRAVALAVSGVAHTNIATVGTVTPASCSANNGSIALTATGGTAPLSYFWNSSPPQFTASASGLAGGTYISTVTDLNGCQKKDTFIVTQSSAITAAVSTTAADICLGDTATLTATPNLATYTYTWMPGNLTGQSIKVWPTDTTTYTVTIQNGAGCSSTATVKVNVKKKPAASFTASPLRFCLGSSDTVRFTGTAGSAATYNWNFDNGTVVNGSNSGPYTILFPTAGTHPINLTVTENGCNSNLATQTVTVDAKSQPSFTVTPASICMGDTLQVAFTGTAAPGSTNTWTWGGGTVLSGTGLGPYSVSYNTGGTIQLIINNNTCSDTGTQTVIVKTRPVASFTAAPQRFCQRSQDTVTFTGTAGNTATYNWNFDNGTVVTGTGAGPYILQFPTAGTHPITLTVVDNGCSSSTATSTVTVDGASLPAFTVSPASICSGDTVQVNFNGTAFAGSTSVWNWGGGTVLSGSGLGPYAVKYTTTGTIQLVLNNNTCTDTAAIKTVAVTQLPVPAFTPSALRGCTPLTVSFTNNSQNSTSYLWQFENGANSTNPNPQYTFNNPGTFVISLAATNGNCSDATTQTIQIMDPPVADFTSTPDVTATPITLSQAQFNFINNSTGATNYSWHFGDKDSSRQTNPLHRYITTGAFTVSLYAYNIFGCVDSISAFPYIIIADTSLRIPNAFSPNNDGINDRWQIAGLLGYPNCNVEIFDRYGQSLFRSIGYNNPWDGKRNSKDLPVGTYYYVIRTTIKTYVGWVFLIR